MSKQRVFRHVKRTIRDIMANGSLSVFGRFDVKTKRLHDVVVVVTTIDTIVMYSFNNRYM